MTDSDIIKYLKKHSIYLCSECKVEKTCLCNNCVSKLERNAIDLIKRQKAEIERLERKNEILSINADTAFQDGLNEAQDIYAEQVKAEIKSKAIKEFADRLKEKSMQKFDWNEYIEFEEIDNLVKEMVGEE